jgi:hypothetical protein
MWGQTSCCHSLVSLIQEPLVEEEAVEVVVGAETVVVEVVVGDEAVARRWAVVDEEVADDHSAEAEEVARRWAVVDEDEAASRSSEHINNEHALCCR